MKIIDLLNMIARGEEPPKKILFEDIVYVYEDGIDYVNGTGLEKSFLLDQVCNDETDLNKEVEILEITIHNQNKIGFVNTYVLCDSDFERKGEYSLKATEIIDRAFEEYSKALNEIIKRLSEDQE